MDPAVSTYLATSDLFRKTTEGLPWAERVRISYAKAEAVVHAYNLTAEDILTLSNKYWAFHSDPVLVLDGSVGTLLTIHYNLCCGTLAMFAIGRPDLRRLLDDLLSYRVSGQFCLTEVGHGLDAINLETTATKLSDGRFLLRTPHEASAKFMPPTAPCGIPCIAIVFARLIVSDEDRGVRPFVVSLHDGTTMNEGVVCRLIPPRGGAHPVDHALTYFHGVYLPPTALLGTETLSEDNRADFFYYISRVISGTLSMGAFALSAMRIASCVAGRYSLRREVMDSSKRILRPIASFSTQYLPILTAIAEVKVMQAFSHVSHARFTESSNSLFYKHFVAALFKITIMHHATGTLRILGDRCGAQGLLEINQLTVLEANIRGAAIAEGDVLGISIRFAVEILLGRVAPPAALDSTSVLAKHEQGLVDHFRTQILDSGHRAAHIETVLLPHYQHLMEAIGHRCAYDAALELGVDSRIIDLYVAAAMSSDEAWYVEHQKIPQMRLKRGLIDAATALYPFLGELLDGLKADAYVTAPIVSDDQWNSFVQSLPTPGHAVCRARHDNGGKRFEETGGFVKALS
ncbi:acyl-CoA dehydrogenase NM domain-like protein [Heliocybe sulcata]|uniref:Acyl-CoA dehydrogenase NM domain-like protein n=1 Tax=Heliocybe sulcata TaxID=5364 RepID=A0A5C3NHQ8_9AGAM|nr:acyl-CoA dehydrogenase NM domain-like protein [Heliocybe sulcata]